MEPEVIFCRYVINWNGVKPVADKVDAISNTPEPKGVSQLRAFLGMLNYYHRFLPDLSTVLEALHKLLRKEKKWRWAQDKERRTLLYLAELLVYFDPTKELILASGASNYGIGAVLSQRMRDGSQRHEP